MSQSNAIRIALCLNNITQTIFFCKALSEVEHNEIKKNLK